MFVLSKIGLQHFWEGLKNKFIKSNALKEILVVDELPEVEQEGVLYLVKENEIIEPENLYYQEEEKDYTSSSGINYIFGVDKTITLNGAPSSDASTYSNPFLANLDTNKTYKLKATYNSGDVVNAGDIEWKIYLYLNNDDVSQVKLLEKEIVNKENVEEIFTPTVSGQQIYGIRVYVYAGNEYQNLKYDIAIEEVK